MAKMALWVGIGDFGDLARKGAGLLLVTMEWCAVKGAGQQRVQVPPGNWIPPPGSNRSSGGGNEAVGAFEERGRIATLRACRLQFE
jgi:hypothetical protein